jgi:hypothetical protein
LYGVLRSKVVNTSRCCTCRGRQYGRTVVTPSTSCSENVNLIEDSVNSGVLANSYPGTTTKRRTDKRFRLRCVVERVEHWNEFLLLINSSESHRINIIVAQSLHLQASCFSHHINQSLKAIEHLVTVIFEKGDDVLEFKA